VRDNWVSPSLGRKSERSKPLWRALTGRAHAVATVNGTAALQSRASLAAGVRAGDRVMRSRLEPFAASRMQSHMPGLTASFVDVGEARLGPLDPAFSLPKRLPAIPNDTRRESPSIRLGHTTLI